jgi:hypothetical protein
VLRRPACRDPPERDGSTLFYQRAIDRAEWGRERGLEVRSDNRVPLLQNLRRTLDFA